MAHDIKLVRRGVGDRHGAGKIGRRGFHVAVEIVHHQRAPELPCDPCLSHLDIGLVEAAHEAQHYEARATRLLRLHDLYALGERLRQGFFTENTLGHRGQGRTTYL